VRFLLDLSVPQLACTELRAAGHDATHAADLGLSDATDETLLALARAEDRLLITCAANTVEMLHVPQQGPPSLLLNRKIAAATAQQFTTELLAAVSVELAQLLREARRRHGAAAGVTVTTAGQLRGISGPTNTDNSKTPASPQSAARAPGRLARPGDRQAKDAERRS
jgi:predicted nuclease of predicted toxin-antitoxin system